MGRLRSLEQGYCEQVLHNSSRWKTIEEERAQALRESNALLRQEVQDLARTIGAAPPPHLSEPDRTNWVPVVACEPPRFAATPTLAPPQDVVTALGTFVRATVQRHLSGDELFTPDAVSKYVDQTLNEKIGSIVRGAVGVDQYGEVKADGPLTSRLQVIVAPLLEEALPKLTDAVSEKIATLFQDERFVSDFQGKATDLFARTLRTEIEKMVAKKATGLAQRVVDEAGEKAILEELPWLKRYVVASKLGRNSDDL